jgi:hypothetical protein
VLEQAPVCRELGRYVFRASGGPNVVRAPKRIRGHRLGIGTYRFIAFAAGKPIFDVRVRLASIDAKLVARKDHLADVCAPRVALSAGDGGVNFAIGGPASGAAKTPQASGGLRGGTTVPTGQPKQATGVFQPPRVSPSDPSSSLSGLRPLLFALLALSIGLLGAAVAVPGRAANSGTLGIVVHHRAAVSAAGLVLLVAAALLAVLS